TRRRPPSIGRGPDPGEFAATTSPEAGGGPRRVDRGRTPYAEKALRDSLAHSRLTTALPSPSSASEQTREEASLLAQDRIHHPASTHVRTRRAAVREDAFVSTAGVFQGVGQDVQAGEI